MTGKTHMAISAAAVAVLLAVTDVSGPATSTGLVGMPQLLPVEGDLSRPGMPNVPSVAGTAGTVGMLLLGIVAGLFPDLDAPDTELQHLPNKAARQLQRYIRAGTRSRSVTRRLAQAGVQLAVLPLTVIVGAIGTGVRMLTGHRGFTHTLWGAAAFTCLIGAIAFLLTGSGQRALPVSAVWLLGYASHLAADACTPSGIPLLGRAGNAEASWRGSHAYSSSAGARPSRARLFHLLPERMRIRTGSVADTLLVRWISWAVFVTAALSMFAD
jgi:membrane-bound metal-dependent hydrolase YbcI (DUF457 family)